jgi:hypothetical protein
MSVVVGYGVLINRENTLSQKFVNALSKQTCLEEMEEKYANLFFEYNYPYIFIMVSDSKYMSSETNFSITFDIEYLKIMSKNTKALEQFIEEMEIIEKPNFHVFEYH